VTPPPFRDLREFATHLEKHGALRRITVPVSAKLEITEITDRVSKGRAAENVALLFERVEGSDMPALVNAFGSRQRMAWALGVEDLDEVGTRVAALLDPRMPGGAMARLRRLGSLIDVARAAPRHVTQAPCQEIVETARPSLAGLPVLTCWPDDAGPFITLPSVFTRHPVTGARNVGMYRLQVFDDRTLGMHWQLHKGGAEHHFFAAGSTSPGAMPVAITRRHDAIYPTTIVGRPPQEDYWLGKATERLFLPIIRLMVPEIVDMNMPAEGVFHNLVIVSIRKRYPGHARKVMHALWGLGLMMLAKTIVVVSEHVNVHDLSEVAWRVTGNIDPRRDLVLADGPMDDLDHAALRHRFGGKLGIDATEKTPDDGITQAWPEEIVMSEDIRTLVTRRWAEYGL